MEILLSLEIQLTSLKETSLTMLVNEALASALRLTVLKRASLGAFRS